jgi:hypothetical protein
MDSRLRLTMFEPKVRIASSTSSVPTPAVGLLWLLLLYLLPGCSPRIFAADPATTGDDPRTTLGTTSRRSEVPYCSGGNRASACAFGANCRVTEQGCQVCQCLSPP